MRIKTVIFDMDGVLVDSMGCHIESWVHSFRRFDISPTGEELALLEGMPYKETIENISAEYGRKLTPAESDRLYSMKKDRMSKRFKPGIFPHVRELLDMLKKKDIRSALVSGAAREFVRAIIDGFFSEDFDIVITGDDVRRGKPDPEPYLKALERSGWDAKDTVVIENAPLGIRSATAAGLHVFALATTLDKRYLEEADKIFSSHAGLLEYFRKTLSDREH